MKSYGLEMIGQISIQEVNTLPDYFPEYDTGRFIHVRDLDAYYLGGLTEWILITAKGRKISRHDILWGTGEGQVSTEVIPVYDPDKIFNYTTLGLILLGIAQGTELTSNSITSRVVNNRCIIPRHLDAGYKDEQINAKAIPCKNSLADPIRPTESNVQLTLDYFANNASRVMRKTISVNAWDYHPVFKYYYTQLSYAPIKGQVFCQFYDTHNIMFQPDKVELLVSGSRMNIYVPYRMDINVVIIG